MTLTYFRARNSWGFTILFGQNMGFEHQNMPRGDSMPNKWNPLFSQFPQPYWLVPFYF